MVVKLLQSQSRPSAGRFALQNNALKFGDVIVCGSRGWERESEEDRKIYARELIRMRMSLDEGNKLKEKEDKLVVLTHYPPFSDKYKASLYGLVCGIRRIRGSIRTPARSRHQCQKGSAVGRHNILSDQLRYAAQYPFEDRFVTLH